MKPVCIPCRRFFRIKKSGFYFLEGMPTDPDAQSGTSQPDKWKPYKLWSADKWECQGCGATILSGFGKHSLAEHYQSDFAANIEKFGATYQVNDC